MDPAQAISLPRMRGDRPQLSGDQKVQLSFTPHARGSTFKLACQRQKLRVYPACAGIDLIFSSLLIFLWRLPRMRGDRPSLANEETNATMFTPHARGSTLSFSYACTFPIVYPACAGIDPRSSSPLPVCEGLPRMRGDRPHRGLAQRLQGEFTPHARGST